MLWIEERVERGRVHVGPPVRTQVGLRGVVLAALFRLVDEETHVPRVRVPQGRTQPGEGWQHRRLCHHPVPRSHIAETRGVVVVAEVGAQKVVAHEHMVFGADHALHVEHGPGPEGEHAARQRRAQDVDHEHRHWKARWCQRVHAAVAVARPLAGWGAEGFIQVHGRAPPPHERHVGAVRAVHVAQVVEEELCQGPLQELDRRRDGQHREGPDVRVWKPAGDEDK
mmetsp:Transcript_10556/g.28701  ORF Transcript_10556/g.28701 Transcript_10556/m.28701 type:complete len:225 (-) Transcript_10556:309-983(-)